MNSLKEDMRARYSAGDSVKSKPKIRQLQEALDESLGGRIHWTGYARFLGGLIRVPIIVDSIGRFSDIDIYRFTFDEVMRVGDSKKKRRSWQINSTDEGLVLASEQIYSEKLGYLSGEDRMTFEYRTKFGHFMCDYRDDFYYHSFGTVKNIGQARWFGIPVFSVNLTGRRFNHDEASDALL